MTESFFQFHTPQYLFLLLLVLPLFIFDVYKLRLIKFGISSTQVIANVKKTMRQRFEFLPALMRFVALTLLVIALARPQWGNQYTEVNSEGIDIVLAIDASGSMQALDFTLEGERVDRLVAVKSVVADFIEQREFDRIGMVVFGEQAYTQCPLTLDYDILTGYLDLIEIGIAGDGTAVGNAIATSVKRLEDSEAKSKIIILLTDGRSNAGEVSPQIAAELAQKRGIKVYTIAVGSKGKKVPFPRRGFFGMKTVQVQLDIDEETLKEIAKVTNAKFYQASNTKSLAEIYNTIDQLEKTEVQMDQFAEYEEKYLNYLIPAIVLLLLAWLLQRSVFLRIP
jgi:Ca-activated chloride channel homolog